MTKLKKSQTPTPTPAPLPLPLPLPLPSTTSTQATTTTNQTSVHLPIFNPFHVLLQEQAKFMVAIKELQSQVQTLYDFRSRVLMAFPHLVESLETAANQQQNIGVRLIGNQMKSGVGGGGRILPSITNMSTSGFHQSPVTVIKSMTNRRNFIKNNGNSKSDEIDLKSVGNCSGRRVALSTFGGKSNGGQKFVVVAQGNNWLRIRPYKLNSEDYEDDGDDEENDEEDEEDSTSDSLHSVRQNKSRAGVLVKSKTIGTSNSSSNSTAMRSQDSGFSTDGKVSSNLHSSSDILHQWTTSSGTMTTTTTTNSTVTMTTISTKDHQRYLTKNGGGGDDELTTVLDQIGHKSQLLLYNQVERISRSMNHHHPGQLCLSDIGLETDQVLTELERLNAERDQLRDRLTSDRLLHQSQLERLQQELAEKETAKRLLEERMDVLVIERDRLISNIHCMHSQFSKSPSNNNNQVKTIKRIRSATIAINSPVITTDIGRIGDRPKTTITELSPTNSTWSSQVVTNDGKLPVHIDRSKFRAILNENRPLELQKQLLSKQIEQSINWSRHKRESINWNRQSDNWKRTEQSLRAEAEVARQSNVQLQVMVHQMEMDLDLERSKRQVLERALHSAYKDLTGQTGTSSSRAPELSSMVTVIGDKIKVSRQPSTLITSNVQRRRLGFNGKPALAFTTLRESTNRFKGDKDYHRQMTKSSDDDDQQDEINFNTLKRKSSLITSNPITHNESTKTINIKPKSNHLNIGSGSGLINKNYLSQSRRLLVPNRSYSQSADDVRDIDDWEWTYDVTHGHQRRALSEART